ncbi:MAG: LysM peptidoglycan-binding domain-containing protein [Bacillota bacterium]
MNEYIVNFGETFYFIARKFNFETKELLAANPGITNPDLVIPGQIIYIPTKQAIKKTISVNGFTLPNINTQKLSEILPYLTYLSILGYRSDLDGTLSNIEDGPLIQFARSASVAPMMVIANIDENGTYSAELAHSILSDPQIQNNLITNVVNVLNDKHYYGLNIDFDYLYPADLSLFLNFVNVFGGILRQQGYFLQLSGRFSTFPQIDEFTQSNTHDNVNQFIIMPNEFSYSLGQILVMAPLDQLQRVLDAVETVPRSKILLGIPNGAFDWVSPSPLGTPGQPVLKDHVIKLYKDVGAIYQYDAITRGGTFNYIDNLGNGHIVWVEGGHGFDFYLQLIGIYNLNGASLWTIDAYTLSDYQILAALYEIRKVIDVL